MAAQDQSRLDEWVDIVDENNEVVAQASRKEMRKKVLRHRATYIVVHDGMGSILAQKRTPNKDFYPGWLDVTAGGVVQSGEEALASARREVDEELGIAGVPLAEHGMFYFESDDCCVWGVLLSCVYHGPFALQEAEIAEVYWMTLEEIESRKSEFTPDSMYALHLWLNRREVAEESLDTPTVATKKKQVSSSTND